MNNLRFMVFMAVTWLFLTVIGNLTDGYNYVTNTNVQDLQDMTQYEVQSSPDALGVISETIRTGINGVISGVLWVKKIASFDYTMFKDVNHLDPVTGEPMDNDWVIMRYLLMLMGLALIVDVFITVKRQ
jgi:hypothetical protein